jgi:hypothetical protein
MDKLTSIFSHLIKLWNPDSYIEEGTFKDCAEECQKIAVAFAKSRYAVPNSVWFKGKYRTLEESFNLFMKEEYGK